MRTKYPYTAMYVSAVNVGFTTADLRTMPYRRIAFFLGEWSNMNQLPDKGGVREATQADIDRILG